MANQLIKLNPKAAKQANFRQGTARAAYWAAIQGFNGQPVNKFAEACAANTPSTPKRGKLAGKQEPVTGWVSWFIRNGYISLVTK